jgi:hypothetical protein
MKKVEAVIQGFKADEVREALANEEIPRASPSLKSKAPVVIKARRRSIAAPDTSKIQPTSRSRSLEAK